MLQAIAAGKHVYCEKPSATSTADALAIYHAAQKAGVKHGVVQDKLWLPGFLKLKHLIDTGFFGEILSVRGEFGYWVFRGDDVPAQRPSWNYKMEAGGGMILDMLSHFRYLLDNMFGKVKSLTCLGATHIKKRWDENREPYACTAEDAAYSTFLLENGIVCHFNASWATRVRRDDLFIMQVDGTQGSAVAGLRDCVMQPLANTPRPVWNPDIDSGNDFYATWKKAPGLAAYENAFKTQWELFLKHVVKNDPFPWTLLEGAKGVQLGELGIQSWKERRWVDVGALE